MLFYPKELLDEGSDWHEKDVPLHERGIRFRWLWNFVDAIYENTNGPLRQDYQERLEKEKRAESQRKASIHFDNVPWPEPVDTREPELLELTTREFVAQYVIPLTSSLKTPLYARVPPSDRGKPDLFLSHAWDAVVRAEGGGGVYGTLDAFGPGVAGVDEEFVWIDFVCYNQHKLTEDAIAFDMESIVRSIGKVAFAVTPVPLFNRIWCLWELLSVSMNECETQFCAAPGYRTEKRMMVNDFLKAFTSVTAARATKDEDRDKLMRAIVHRFGSVEAADDYIRNLMKSGMKNPWFELYSEYRD